MQQETKIIVAIKHVDAFLGEQRLLRDITLSVKTNEILAIVGSNRASKLLLLRLFNRMNDLKKGFSWKGDIIIEDIPILQYSIETLRRKVGLLVEKPIIFPTTIFENIAFGLRLTGKNRERELKINIEKALKRVKLWKRCASILYKKATILTIAEQQRLCLARTIALNPKIILMERPTANLMSNEAAKFEELIVDLKKDYTIIVVTQNKQQAGRISTQTAFLYNGHLIEKSPTTRIFTQPKMELTESYITGRLI